MLEEVITWLYVGQISIALMIFGPRLVKTVCFLSSNLCVSVFLQLSIMAEQEPTPEQLAAIAAENENSESVNYKPPAQKSLQEIQELDKDDESLRKYKEALLGGCTVVAGVCHFTVHALAALT